MAGSGDDRARALALAWRCAAGARCALDWVAMRQFPEGLLGGEADWLAAGHKAPAALALGGHPLQAGRLLTWLVHERLQPDGDLGDAASRPGPERAAWLYFNAWLAWGAQRAGRSDLALPAARFIAARQAGDGSFPSNPHGPEHVVDLFVTSACGLALVEAGHLDAAARAGAFLADALAGQPARDGLQIAWARDAAGEAALAAAPDRAFVRFGSAKRQRYFAAGMALVFLARLELAAGDGGALATAAGYLRACSAMLPGAACWGQGGKVGWGAALVWQQSGDPAALALAEQVLDGYLLAGQTADGRWPREHPAVETDTAAEFGVILAEAAQALGAPLHPAT